MGEIGEFSDFHKGGTENNIYRDLQYTPLNERFKANDDGSIGYRVDINGVSKDGYEGHLTYIGNIFDKQHAT